MGYTFSSDNLYVIAAISSYDFMRSLPLHKGQGVFFSAYRGILSFNIFLTSIVHYNLSEVEEHDLAVLPHSMYSLLEAKDKFCLIFQ